MLESHKNTIHYYGELRYQEGLSWIASMKVYYEEYQKGVILTSIAEAKDSDGWVLVQRERAWKA